MVEMLMFDFEMVENILGKAKNVRYQHFLFFQQ